ncbi:hypothetical protein OKW21_002465 [Catalinimonas alkaloidigena]|uniref:hypothetical protein n=1 Tax=Catalinimonas alkaloidigena TaxID=1075417 RepID=UPI00240533CD|nr:hypothetical protein [Catalinimonas alkaloidigena]MDF9797202.1 hypothetical protein [Catalinimonas alkaloidigena]
MNSMIKNFSLLIFLVVSLSHSFKGFAQQNPNWEEEGEIEEAEVVIEKSREIELPSASRKFERVPPLPVQESTIDINYQFVEVLPKLQPLSPSIRVLKVKEPPLPKLYSNYIKAGFGNYLSPYLEVYANSARSEDYSYGVHFKHLSSRQGPVDGGNSGNSDTKLSLHGKYFAGGHTLFGEASYQRERYHFYGYTPGLELSRDSIKQIFNTISLSGGVERSEVDAAFDYRLKLNYKRLSDAYEATENQFGINLLTSLDIAEPLTFVLQTDIWAMNRQDIADIFPNEPTSISRNLFRFKPYFKYSTSTEPQEGLEVKAGVNFVYENDTIVNAEKLHVYPYAEAQLHLTNSLKLYASLSGDIERKSLLDFTNENPWMRPDVPLANTNRNFSFGGGVAGRASSLLGFNAGFSANNYKNLYFFVNSASDSTKFDILYDTGDVFIFNAFAELNINSQDRFRTTIRGDYFAYSMGKLENPWHRPDVKLSLLSSYNIYDKLLINAELMVLGGLRGLNLASGTEKDLGTIADMSFKADYLFSPRFSTFLQLKNIFAQNYERYLNYPSRGIMVMGGITYSF